MKVSLVGAPGSGKTELAQQLKESLPDTTIVDDYIAVVEDRSDIALGHFATYIGNMQAAIGRFEAERLAAKKSANVITCGSIIETSVYQAINAYTLAQSSNDRAWRAMSDQRANITMMWFGVFRHDTVDYDHVLYLPLSDAAKERDGNNWSSAVDDQIVEAAEALGIDISTLPADPDARIKAALEILGGVDEVEASVGQAVSGSSETGTGDGEAT